MQVTLLCRCTRYCYWMCRSIKLKSLSAISVSLDPELILQEFQLAMRYVE